MANQGLKISSQFILEIILVIITKTPGYIRWYTSEEPLWYTSQFSSQSFYNTFLSVDFDIRFQNL
jgi:hypothetical protein